MSPATGPGVTPTPGRRPPLEGGHDPGRRRGREHPATDAELVERLRSGDEQAFASLVDTLHLRLHGAARMIAPSAALAEEAVQETWLAVIRGIDRFEGRSTLTTWIFSILFNRARTLAARERRVMGPPAGFPGARLGEGDSPDDDPEPGMGPSGRWEDPPVPWGLEDPAAVMARRETFEVVSEALAGLPEHQRLAVLLRDVEGLPSEAACNILAVTETNLRVLLHRGRRSVRRALDRYVREGVRPGSAGHARKER